MGGRRGYIPQNLRWGDGYITIPQYGWLTGQPTRLQHAFFYENNETYMQFLFSSVKYQIYIYFQNKYQFGGFVHWTPYWVFAPEPHWVTSVP